jgi:hypothetical protein
MHSFQPWLFSILGASLLVASEAFATHLAQPFLRSDRALPFMPAIPPLFDFRVHREQRVPHQFCDAKNLDSHRVTLTQTDYQQVQSFTAHYQADLPS